MSSDEKNVTGNFQLTLTGGKIGPTPVAIEWYQNQRGNVSSILSRASWLKLQ
jgi:hypothetical protein